MCYQEHRWHTICNHAVQATVECSKQCSQYGAIDRVETQLAAYCHACRRHIDSTGIAGQHRTTSTNSRLSRRRSSIKPPAHNLPPQPLPPSSSLPPLPPLASSQSVENVCAAAVSPASSLGTGSSLSRAFPPGNRPNTVASTGDLSEDMMKGFKASGGAIMSVFVQKQREASQERAEEDMKLFMSVSGAVLEIKSPTPRKPLLSLRIPEEAVSEFLSPTPTTANTVTSDGADSAQANLSPTGTEITAKSPKLDSAHPPQAKLSPAAVEPANSPRLGGTAPLPPATIEPPTPKTPPFISVSLEEHPSKPLQGPLPSLPELSPKANMANPAGFGSTLIDLHKGVRRNKSSSRLLGGKIPDFSQHKNAPIQPTLRTAATTTTKATKTLGKTPPLPLPLRTSKSSQTLNSDATSTRPSPLSYERDWSGKTPTPSRIARPRPEAPAGTHSRPGSKRELIDIHDLAWLSKHRLKWDVHGLDIVSAAM